MPSALVRRHRLGDPPIEEAKEVFVHRRRLSMRRGFTLIRMYDVQLDCFHYALVEDGLDIPRSADIAPSTKTAPLSKQGWHMTKYSTFRVVRHAR